MVKKHNKASTYFFKNQCLLFSECLSQPTFGQKVTGDEWPVCLSVYLSIYIYIHFSHLFIYLYVHQPIYLNLHILFIYLSIYLSTYKIVSHSYLIKTVSIYFFINSTIEVPKQLRVLDPTNKIIKLQNCKY